jgi:CRP/FNR family transcriptional regulator, cyclic AMP receptor protein
MQASLQGIPLFAGVQDDALRPLAEKALIRTFPKNTIIVHEGDVSQSLYVILSGKVRVFLGDDSGKELIVDIKGPGQYFGEMALDEKPRSASVMTMEASRFAIISKSDFRAFLQDHPNIGFHVIENLIKLVRGMNGNIKSLAMMDVYGRVARMLLDLATETDGKLVIRDRLTQKDMASRVGASREMINRILKDLSVGGYIKVEGGRITITKTPPPRW